ncbi:9699_t:CDS:2, partial [Cetraspora pellucida]
KKFAPVDRRFYSIPLLQEKNKVKFTSFKLLDFVTQFEFILFNPNNLNDTLNIPGTETQLTKLLSPFKIDFYFVRICDKKLAKKIDLKITDVLINSTNIRGHQFDEDKIKRVMEWSVVIPCEGCVFKDHTVMILFIIVNYMNSLYQSQLNNNEINADDKILLGENFGDLNSRYP